MHLQSIPYVLPLLMAAAVSAALALYAWRRRSVPEAASFAWLMLAGAWWSLAYALELGSVGKSAKLFWVKVEYPGIVIMPAAWLAFVLQYTGQEKRLSRRNLLLLAIVPLVTLIMVWTSGMHRLFYSSARLDTGGPWPVLDLTYRGWFWVHIAYSYLSLLLGTLLLLWMLLRSPSLYRGQARALLIGALVPWLGSVLYVFDLSPLPNLDLTPFAFTITGLAVTWGLFRFRLLDIIPVARDAVIEGMSDSVIVLDTQSRIVDLNPAAGCIIGHAASEVVGQPIAQILSARPDLIERYHDATEVHTEITLGPDEARRHHDLRISPLYDRRGYLTGRLVVLRDITQRKRAEAALQEAEERFRTIFENAAIGLYRTTPDGKILAANQTLIQMLGYASFEELAQRNLEEAGFEPDYPRAVFKQQIEKEGQVIGLESAWTWRDGTVRFVRENARVIRDDAGNVLYYEGTVEDITDRKRVEKELRVRERFLVLLNDITRAALETPDLPAMLQILADRLGELFDADGCYLTLWDEATQTTVPTAAYGAWCEAYPSLRPEPGEVTMTESVLRAGRPLVVEDVFDTPYLSQRIAELFPARSLLGLPLIAGDQKLGAALIAFNEPHHFTPDEIARGEQAAGQIALAVAKARLHAETQRRLQEQIALREAGAIISSALDLETVLSRIAEQMGRAVDATSAYICSWEQETMTATVLAEYIGPQACVQERVSDLGDSYLEDDIEFLETMRAGQHNISHVNSPDISESERAHMQKYGAQTILYIPLKIRGRFVGYTELWESRRRRKFTPEEIALCQGIAQQAAIAIENARLFEETEQLAVQMTTLNRIGRHVASILDQQGLFQRTVNAVWDDLGYLWAAVLLMDEEAGELYVAAATDNFWEVIPDDYRQPVGKGAIGIAAETGETVLVKDASSDPRVYRAAKWFSPSSLSVPLKVGGQVVGVLEVEADVPNAFDDGDVTVMGTLAAQVAVAIENARLYGTLQRELAERVHAEAERERLLAALERRSTQLQTAAEVSHAASSILDPDELIQGTVDLVRERFDLYYAGLFLVDQTGEWTGKASRWVVLQAGTGQAGRQMVKQGHKLEIGGTSMIGWCVAHKKARIALDVGEEAVRFDNPLLPETRSELALPLISRGEAIGAMTIQSTQEAAFSEEDIAVLQTMADQLANAIKNAQLYDQIQRELVERTRAEQALRQHTAALQARNEELGAFAHTVAHDLKNPLGHVIGYAEALDQDYAALPEEDLRHYLQTIAQSGRKMSNIIDELLLLAGVREMEEVEMGPLDMAHIVAEAQARLADLIGERRAEIILTSALTSTSTVALGYGPWLEEVWVNYLSNAIKYGGDPPRVELGANQLTNQPTIHFWVRDNGPGLTPEEQARLFTPFTRLNQVRAKGHGLGLSIVRRIVEKLGGQVGVESQVGRGSVFSFTLPAAEGA